MAWRDWNAVRVRVPLILVASGIVLGAVTWLTGMEARTATMLRASRTHTVRYFDDISASLQRPGSVAGDEMAALFAQLRESQRSFELAALVAPDGRIVYALPRSAVGRPLEEAVGTGPGGALLAVTDTLPAAVSVPRPRIATVVRLGRGPLTGHRIVVMENLERRLKMAQLDALEQALPTISAGLLLVVAITLLLDRWLRRPAQRLEETANRIASGDVTARAGLTGASELDQVGRALDHMAEEIERARREMLSSRRTAEILLDSLPFAVILTDRDTGRVLFMNARWHETTQHSVQPGDRLYDQLAKELLLHLDGTPYAYDELATPIALRTGKPAIVSDIVTVRPDGRRDHESAHATPISLGGERDFDAVLTVVQDRKEIMALAGEVRTWEQRFQRVVEATGQVVYEWDLEAGTVRRSGNQELVLGFTAEQERTTNARTNWEERMHPDDRDRVVAQLEECLRSGEPFDSEYRTRRAPGQYVTIHDRGFFDRSPDGRVVRVSGTMSDVTAQRETEAQLRQAQKMETVGTLAGGVAHDFNNQLTGVIGHLDLLERSLAPGDERAEHARIARVAAERCAELTRGLLAFSRRLHSRPTPASLNEVVRESVQLLRRVLPASIAVETALEPDLPTVHVDITQIQQVLFNLCINARDAMPAGGRLVLRTERVTVTDGDRRHPDSYAGDFVRLEVQDTGEGIPADARARIFEPFFTTKPVGEGTGLGLSMAYGIVSKHRGWIDVATREGEGSCFRVYVPAAPEATASAPTSRSAAPGPRSSGELVMVVDDEPLLRQLAIRALEDAGYRVIEAGGAERALELAREHAGELRAVLLDMTMPGMSGAQALPRLLEIAPQARMLLSSGYSAASSAALAGAAGFLPKPYAPSDLVAAIRSALAGPAPSEPAGPAA